MAGLTPQAAHCSRQQAPVLDILIAVTVRLGCSSSQMRSRPERVGDRSHMPSRMCPVVHIEFLLVWQQGVVTKNLATLSILA